MRNGYTIVDADRHLLEPVDLWVRYIDPKYRERAPFLVSDFCGTAIVDGIQNNGGTEFNGMKLGEISRSAIDGRRNHLGFWKDVHWRKQFYEAMEDNFGPKSYLADMDRSDIDVAICFGTAQLYFNWRDDLEPGYSDAICRAYNDWLYEFRGIAPDRIYGVAAVPMHDPKLAVKEAQRAVSELGHVGFYLRPNVFQQKPWHHPDYDYFWSAAEELGKPVCFHEGSTTNQPQARLPYVKNQYMRHAMCHPFEQMLAVLSMTAMGVMERHPKLKVFFAEATSGWVPPWLERLDWLYTHKLVERYTKEKPSFYFNRQGAVSCESGEETLESYEALVSTDTLFWASDYPHPDQTMKFPDTVGALIVDPHISDEFRRKILFDNPVRMFALDVKAGTRAKVPA